MPPSLRYALAARPLAAHAPLRHADTSSLRSFWRGLLGKDEAEADDAVPEAGDAEVTDRHSAAPRAAAPATAAQHAGRTI